ncbi:MAG: DUF4351 domain-containing protein [Acaryochloris sp. RU_4_1]|nr:DUF4351 domain-containing protein [Acaryochloris sp. RU_4_1]NJR55337.1 DUF4351 domain-containing protein [Acaryochloris sp. CRU_2_0]
MLLGFERWIQKGELAIVLCQLTRRIGSTVPEVEAQVRSLSLA